MTTTATIIKQCVLCILVGCVLPTGLHAQSNKPVTNAQVPVATNPIATLPTAYSSNILLNYVRTKEAIGPYTDITAFNAAGYSSVKEVTQYVDGLGRPLQTVLRQATPDAKDMVSPVVYDEYGREVYKYIPYVSTENNGSFKIDPFSAYGTGGSMQIQYSGEQVFYSQTDFETSPLNRVLKRYAPGNSWAGRGKGIGQQYLINSSTDLVQIWNIGNDPGFDNSIPASIQTYPAGTLFKTVSSDEEDNEVIEFKDKEGKVILKKVQVTTNAVNPFDNYLNTYYVYDDFGLLRFVISPKAVKWLSENSWTFSSSGGNDVINELCFRYEYDSRKRMTAKKIPGAGWVYIVYDKRDRAVFTQDANMRKKRQWMTILYDELNRPVLTGMIVYPTNGTASGTLADFTALQKDEVNANFGTNPTTVAANKPSRSNYSDEIVINSSQSGEKHYKATNKIILDNGFTMGSTSKFIAEIAENTDAPSNASIPVNNNPVPFGCTLIALTLTYYDDYNFTDKIYKDSYNDPQFLFEGNNPYKEVPLTINEQGNVSIKGKIAGTSVRTLPNPDDLAAGYWLTTTNFYDTKGRSIQTQSDNYNGGEDIITNLYDFSGKVLCNYSVHNNPQNADVALQQIKVRTRMEYDHTGRVLKIWKQINGIDKVVTENDYDAIGQLIKKKLGTSPNDPGEALQELDYEYNIQGWLKSINKDYVQGNTNDKYFGMNLSYDWGFDYNKLNGNIAGTQWRSKGDGEKRAYGFGYDKVNRLMYADFNQYTNDSWNKDAGVNFNSIMGDGITPSTAYDANGNILKMQQWGLKLTGSEMIDNLDYTYNPNSNKLKNVIDGSNDIHTRLGDFRSSEVYLTYLNQPKTNIAKDYRYDDNGNMVEDLNKNISTTATSENGIKYNHLNLPSVVSISKAYGSGLNTAKGYIRYIYDALGNKLQKITKEYTGSSTSEYIETTTIYLAGFVYESKIKSIADPATPDYNNVLQFFGQEEGRVRSVKKTVNNTEEISFAYDYFIKDHLGNTRVILTDEQREDPYPVASMEDAPSTIAIEEAVYTNLNSTRTNKPEGYPDDDYTYPNNKVARVSGGTGQSDKKIGPSITLKVMAGDELNVRVNSWYKTNNVPLQQPNNILPSALVSALAGSVGEMSSIHSGITATDLETNGILTPAVTEFLNNKIQDNSKPKAYLSWVLLDEHFNIAKDENGNIIGSGYSGFEQVPAELEYHNDQIPNNNVYEHIKNLPIAKNGYLYVYVSNETPNIDVFFDNLQVTHIRGPLLEETHYYPFGLAMAGISSKTFALDNLDNKRKFNDGTELTNDFDISIYETEFRGLDPQIGRWLQIDPLIELGEDISPYSFADNNPIFFNDPYGLSPSKGDGYVQRTDGSIFFDPNVHSQSDLDPNSGLTYLQERIKVTNNEGVTWWDENGNSTTTDPGWWGDLNGITVTDAMMKKGNGNGSFLFTLLDGGPRMMPTGFRTTQGTIFDNPNNPFSIENRLIRDGLIIIYGLPLIPKPFRMPGSSRGTSIASIVMRKIIPSKWTVKGTLGNRIGTIVARRFATNGLGAAVGRAVPYVGWAWLMFYDIPSITNEVLNEYFEEEQKKRVLDSPINNDEFSGSSPSGSSL